MKTILTATLFSLFAAPALMAQVSLSLDSLDPGRQAVYGNILSDYEKEKQRSEEERNKLNAEITAMRATMEKAKNLDEKVKAFEKNVQLLEKNQQLADERSQNIYVRNYYIAVGEVLLMEEDIKPVNLLEKSESFFSALGDAANPMKYPGYSDFMGEFKKFIDAKKGSEVALQVVDQALNLTQNISSGLGKEIPFLNTAGPIVGMIANGISSFINANPKNAALREKGKLALELNTILGQYSYEMSLVHQEWTAIREELTLLKDLRTKIIEENLDMLGITATEFRREYTDQAIHIKKADYIQNIIRKKIEEKVATAKKANPDNWKTDFHHQMEAVKSLKLRFGSLTMRILNNLKNYEKILDKFKDTIMKDKITEIKPKLESLRTTFNDNFRPERYVEATSTMYEVE